MMVSVPWVMMIWLESDDKIAEYRSDLSNDKISDKSVPWVMMIWLESDDRIAEYRSDLREGLNKNMNKFGGIFHQSY